GRGGDGAISCRAEPGGGARSAGDGRHGRLSARRGGAIAGPGREGPAAEAGDGSARQARADDRRTLIRRPTAGASAGGSAGRVFGRQDYPWQAFSRRRGRLRQIVGESFARAATTTCRRRYLV